MIAGLLTAPSTLAPTSNLTRSQNRAATVIIAPDEGSGIPVHEGRAGLLAATIPRKLSTAAQARAGGIFRRLGHVVGA